MAVFPVDPWHSNRANRRAPKFGYVPTGNYLGQARAAGGDVDNGRCMPRTCAASHFGDLPCLGLMLQRRDVTRQVVDAFGGHHLAAVRAVGFGIVFKEYPTPDRHLAFAMA